MGPADDRAKEKMHPLVRLARETVESYVRQRKTPEPKEVTPEMKERAGVFVSIKKLGVLRGCIGTFEPTRPNVAEETIANAVSSATSDPRFPPVDASELDQLSYSVDVLTKPEPVKDVGQLDPSIGREGLAAPRAWVARLRVPQLSPLRDLEVSVPVDVSQVQVGPSRYGVIVESGGRRGLLLPSLEGVNTVEEQIAICRQKAGILPHEPIKLHRFEVRRYSSLEK